MSDESVVVPYEEAVKRIGEGERIHTFRQGGRAGKEIRFTKRQ